MIGYLINGEKKECFGCCACAQICPKAAITMELDSEGFQYPKIDLELCVSCKKCHQACPVENNPVNNNPIRVIAGYSKEESIRLKSASGGAFHAIVSAASEDTIIFGAEWASRSSVKHASAFKDEAYERFCKSKYIQSDINTTYTAVKEMLKQGKNVIFSGTPCQVAGLKVFLGKDYPNLICIDLICHGVPSGKVLEKYLSDMESEKNGILSISFRHKICKNKVWNSKFARILFYDGSQRLVDYDSSGFLRGFANGLFLRPSCSVCPYAQIQRGADLTIGDFWGAEKADMDLDAHHGVSLILINTEKGNFYINIIAQFMTFQEININVAIAGNARLRNPDLGHKNRDDFFSDLDTVPFEKLVQRYIPKISSIKKIGSKLKKIIKEGRYIW